MYYYEIAPTRIIRRDHSSFTYHSNDELSPGHIVKIELGKKLIIGIVIHRTIKPTYITKSINSLLFDIPIPVELIKTAIWISDYYETHLSIVLQLLLPRGIETNRRNKQNQKQKSIRYRTNYLLNDAQKAALNQINKMDAGKSILLHGITGSGKTLVYIESSKAVLREKKSVLILVPEIALTPQIIDEFSMHFNNVVFTHSKQTEAERHITWKKVFESQDPMVVIGPRSALFLPVRDVGLIVIDESHEPSYKQEQSPRYSALRVSSVMAKFHGAKVIFGSATPSVVDYHLADMSGGRIIKIDQTAKKSIASQVTLVDMTKKQYFSKHRFFSDVILTKINEALTHGHQVLVFHNRRGSAQTTLCESCGWSALCPKCYLSYTLHTDSYLLRCHLCNNTEKIPTECPTCRSTKIIHKGLGTKIIETELKKIFPNQHIARFDGDNTSKDSLEKKYRDIYEGKINIIIGTQIVAKGLDLPKLRLVCVVQADTGLFLPDYSANERTFQLLAQVVGRVGRTNHQTSVVVQSYTPSNHAIRHGISQNYSAYYKQELQDRQKSKFPPFVFLLKLMCTYKSEAAAINQSKKLAKTLKDKLHPHAEILGPTPAFYERQNGAYQWQIIIKAKKRSILQSAIEYMPPTHWKFEIDPISLL